MNVIDMLEDIHRLCMRINLETELCAWYNISGHVGQLSLYVKAEKGDFAYQDITRHEFYYDKKDYHTQEEYEEKLKKNYEIVTQDLNSILSRTYTKKYTAFCNLIDMACSETFTSLEAAKAWENKMKRKYKKIGAIIGIKEETV